jgi:hypothetical protein
MRTIVLLLRAQLVAVSTLPLPAVARTWRKTGVAFAAIIESQSCLVSEAVAMDRTYQICLSALNLFASCSFPSVSLRFGKSCYCLASSAFANSRKTTLHRPSHPLICECTRTAFKLGSMIPPRSRPTSWRVLSFWMPYSARVCTSSSCLPPKIRRWSLHRMPSRASILDLTVSMVSWAETSIASVRSARTKLLRPRLENFPGVDKSQARSSHLHLCGSGGQSLLRSL